MSSLSTSEWDLEGFQPRQSLWKLVEDLAPENEQSEIKEILGEDVIDETVDLHKEVAMLLEIWQDYRDDCDKKTKELLLTCHFNRLPEPPEMRSNMKKEIQLFVKALKERSVENGRYSTDSLSLSKREKGMVDYAFKETGRPMTGESSQNGRLTPCRPTSSRSGSRSSSLSDVIESCQEQLTVEHVDRMAEKFRNILLEEKELLLEDITFLQNSLFEESHHRENLPSSCETEPSLQELKELGIKLEKEMTKKGGVLPTQPRKPSYSSPSRRPQRKGIIVRSLSSPVVNIGTDRSKGVLSAIVTPKSIPVSQSPSESESLSPSPPTSALSRRPGSASRFRKMVLQSRSDES